MTIKAVVFDLDGTLLDTAPDFVFVLNRLRGEEGLPDLDETRIRNTVSDGARALITLGFDLREGEPDFERLRLRLLELYIRHLAVKSALFPGMAELLLQLQNEHLGWGIATNKPERFTLPLLAALNLAPGCTICPDHVAEPKPHPESLQRAAGQLGCEPGQIIYVGDHLRDIECGRQAGCITVAAAYGYIKDGDNVDTWQADHRVDDVAGIWSIVRQYLMDPDFRQDD